jgi:hypothetical protein
MYRYRAYGLAIDSTLILPGFPEAVDDSGLAPDVVIREERATHLLAGEGVRCHDYAAFMPDEAYFYWHLVGGYLARAGREIVIEAVPGAEPGMVRVPLLGTVLAVLLFQRGLLVLRASAVAGDASAVMFLGAKGTGKSTLAAAVCARGGALLADDVVAVDVRDPDAPVVLPGPLVPRLWPEADDSLMVAPGVDGKPPAPPVAADRSGLSAMPLRTLFTLVEGRSLAVTRLGPKQALRQMVAHTHVARFGSRLLQGAGAAAHLKRCAAVLEHVPVYCLRRSLTFASLPQAAELIDRYR